MGPDQSNLLGGWRRPWRCRLPQGQPSNGDVVYPYSGGVEDALPYIDFGELLVGIDPSELCPDCGVVGINFPKPEWLSVADLEEVILLGRLNQPLAIQVNGARVMLAMLGIEPIAMNEVVIGIESAEE